MSQKFQPPDDGERRPSVGFFPALAAVFIVTVIGSAVGRAMGGALSGRQPEISPTVPPGPGSPGLEKSATGQQTSGANFYGGKRRVWAWFIPTLVAIFSFYFWNTYSSNNNLFNGDGGRYGDVANAFLQGHLYLLIEPDPKLLSAPDPYDSRADRGDILWDGAFYKGKYYFDRGVTPALFLFLPYQLITGHVMNQALAFFIVCVVNVLLFTALLRLMVRFRFPHVPLFWQLALVVVYSFSNLSLYHMRRGWMYEMEEMAGATVLLALFIALFLLLHLPRQRTFWMLVTGLIFGLAAATRANYIFAGVAPFFAWLYLFQTKNREGITGARFAVQTAVLVLPALLIGLAMAWYNQARFGSPVNFGQVYCLNSYDMAKPIFSIWYLADRLWEDLFMPPLFCHRFPFVVPGPRLLPGVFADRMVWGPVCSMFACAPVCWFAFLWRREASRLPDPRDLQYLRVFGFCVFAAWLMVSIPDFIYYAIDIRHVIDIGMPLLVLATLSILARRERAKFSKTYLIVLMLAMVISVYVGFAFGLIGTWNWIGVDGP
jgi:hypothetical protein